MKKYVFTESQIKKILSDIIQESDEQTTNHNKTIQCFLSKKFGAKLNIDGIIGNQTTQYIEKYQSIIGVDQDGVWGEMTINNMKKEDITIWKQCHRKFNPLFGV